MDHLYRFNKVTYTIDTRGYENKKVVFNLIKTQRKRNTRKLNFTISTLMLKRK